MGFAQLLHHDILVRSMEVIMVLQCIVVIQVFADVQVLYGGLVIFGVDDRSVLGVIDVRIAIDGKRTQASNHLGASASSGYSPKAQDKMLVSQPFSSAFVSPLYPVGMLRSSS